ncbi:MAG: tetratricopeptide repeat protein [Pseudomonadales bacterium]|nr:tetratricopeptide repeat protein [Pseudomonadales bacterium]NIX08757.1 tetratricopeptide repeat protein [Pseudomonadales bacterium]
MTLFLPGLLVLLLGFLVGCDPRSPGTADAARRGVEPTPATISYAGSERCAACHADQHEAWLRSHHRRAMETPGPESVVADFDDAKFVHGETTTEFRSEREGYAVYTDGEDGEIGRFPVTYTFGIEPLQQYLLPLPGGRLQALSIAWDSRPQAAGGQRWFHLHPEERGDHTDVLHWTQGSQNWNYMCADCHSTNVRKGYDGKLDEYDTSFSEVTVGCEACHGPASAHVEWALTGNGQANLPGLKGQAAEINACAPCHSRRSQIAESFRPDRTYLDHYVPALLDEGLYHSDGQILDEVFVYGSFLQSRMHTQGVSCSNCHDPHSAGLRVTGNAVCTQCHSQAGQADFPTLTRARYDDVSHHFHPDAGPGSQCVDCHMPARTYMQVDDRRDHSFRIPRPDLTVELGVPNACNGCHEDRPPQWARDFLAERFGEPEAEHYGAVLDAARRADPGAERALAALAEDQSRPAIIRATALSLMTGYDRGASSFALGSALRDPSPLVRLGALRGAERWPPERRWRSAAHLLDDDHLAVRLEATRVLAAAAASLPATSVERLQRGVAEYASAQALHADRAEAHTNMAGVYLNLGEPGRAEAALTRAIEINPQWVPALINLADLYRATGRDPQAGAFLDRALKVAPDSAEVLLAKALWLVRQQSQGEALELLARGAAIEPTNPRIAYVYAAGLHSDGRTSEGLEALDTALSANPGNRQLLQAAAAMARDVGQEARALDYVERLKATDDL